MQPGYGRIMQLSDGNCGDIYCGIPVSLSALADAYDTWHIKLSLDYDIENFMYVPATVGEQPPLSPLCSLLDNSTGPHGHTHQPSVLSTLLIPSFYRITFSSYPIMKIMTFVKWRLGIPSSAIYCVSHGLKLFFWPKNRCGLRLNRVFWKKRKFFLESVLKKTDSKFRCLSEWILLQKIYFIIGVA